MTEMSPLRVLHMRTVNGTGGGPDKTILKSCEHLSRAGHQARAFYMLDRRNNTGALESAARELGVGIDAAMEDGPISFSTLTEFDRVLKAGDYQIVHAHDYKSNVLARLMRLRHKYKIVATAHGYNPTSRRELVYYRLERWMFKLADAVIAPTRNMDGLLLGFGVNSKRLHIIHNGIETRGRERPAHQMRTGPARLLYLGRLSEEKDPVNLLMAVSLLRRDGIDVVATLAGDGPERQRVEAKIRELKLGQYVRLLGFVNDVMPLLAEADVLVNPSRTECMPNAILEAMWAGVPVVATDVGGVGEMLRDEVDGLLCPAEDAGMLATGVKRVLADSALAKKLLASATERVMNEFTFEKHMEKTLDLYRRLLAG
jgi:glycosyltransferase involved in cell wall biosynthesis